MEYILSIRKILESIYCRLAFVEYSYKIKKNEIADDILIYRLQLLNDSFRSFKGLILDDWISFLNE